MHRLPEIVTHTYHPGPGPFRNLCTLEDAEAEEILCHLRNAYGRCRSPQYLRRRKSTEAWLHNAAHAKGINPRRHHPVYFFLGDFDDGLDPARPAAITLPLSAFPVEAITFTYRDSMDCLDAPAPFDCVFTLPELEEFIAEFGMPRCGPISDSLGPARSGFVEMQLWDDAPLSMIQPSVTHPAISIPVGFRPVR